MSDEALLAKLEAFRTRTDLKLKPTKHLKDTFTGFDGQEHPLNIRYYQVQMILHLVAMSRFVVGDDTGLGKTAETIAALCYIWEARPDIKAIVLTTKSATPQWGNEFRKFTTGVKVFVCQGTPAQRTHIRDAFHAYSGGPAVLTMGYRTAVQDFRHLQDWSGYILISDEATAYKNPKTQVHQVVRHLADPTRAARVWALTATLIKNNLMEGFGIFQVVKPDAFMQNGRVMTMTQFMFYFCIVEMISIPRSPRKIPKIIGYTAEKVNEFRQIISPNYLGRPKHEVAAELPTLTIKTLEVGLTKEQESKYTEALEGILTVGESSGEEEDKEVTKLTAVTYCQEVVDHLALINCPGDSKKITALVDLLTDGDLGGEKVIVFTRFKKLVNILEPILKKAGLKTVRITGDESGDQRETNKAQFQDPNSGVNVVMITMAGSDAINLQAAKAIVFIDSPWSAGDYLQILGRMIRIGSIHDRVYAVHLVARSKKRATIDHRVMEVLNKKMGLVEAVLGKRLKGDRAKTEVFEAGSDLGDLFEVLREDAKDEGFSPKFIGGKKKSEKKTTTTPVPTTSSPVQKFEMVGEPIDLDDIWD